MIINSLSVSIINELKAFRISNKLSSHTKEGEPTKKKKIGATIFCPRLFCLMQMEITRRHVERIDVIFLLFFVYTCIKATNVNTVQISDNTRLHKYLKSLNYNTLA